MRQTKDPEIDGQVREFGEKMRAVRHDAGLSQVELSQDTKLDRAAISFLERAERSPDLSTLLRIARALSVTPADLLDGVASAGASGVLEQADAKLPTDPASRLGANLRAARKQAGFSQETLAYEAEVDRAAISVYERGGREPNLRTILKLGRALKVRPSVLLDGVQ